MQHDFIRHLRHVALKTFTPIITHGVRENITRTGEISRADAAADLGEALKAVLSVLVPEMEAAIGAGGAEGAVLRVEGDSVNAVNVTDVALRRGCRAVAFEGEVRRRVFVLDVLDRAPPFDAPHRESRVVVEA